MLQNNIHVKKFGIIPKQILYDLLIDVKINNTYQYNVLNKQIDYSLLCNLWVFILVLAVGR